MWLILSLSTLLAVTGGTSAFAEGRPSGPYSAPWLSRQLVQAAPPATIDQRSLGEARPAAMRQCLQQALFWLGRYQGPVDGRASPAYIEALRAYADDRRGAYQPVPPTTASELSFLRRGGHITQDACRSIPPDSREP